MRIIYLHRGLEVGVSSFGHPCHHHHHFPIVRTEKSPFMVTLGLGCVMGEREIASVSLSGLPLARMVVSLTCEDIHFLIAY